MSAPEPRSPLSTITAGFVIGWASPPDRAEGASHLLVDLSPKGSGNWTACGRYGLFLEPFAKAPRGKACKRCAASRYLDGRFPGWKRPESERNAGVSAPAEGPA